MKEAIIVVIILTAISSWFVFRARAQPPQATNQLDVPKKTPSNEGRELKTPAGAGRELRLKMLTEPPPDWGLNPTPEYPHVCGVLMDWPIETTTVSVISFCSGDASIYTTGSFGVIGGIGHETVRSAAKSFVKIATEHLGDAVATKDFSYPKPGRVRFYIICYDEVRFVEADLEAVRRGNDKYSDLYKEGQRVVTELRLITQNQKGQKP